LGCAEPSPHPPRLHQKMPSITTTAMIPTSQRYIELAGGLSSSFLTDAAGPGLDFTEEGALACAGGSGSGSGSGSDSGGGGGGRFWGGLDTAFGFGAAILAGGGDFLTGKGVGCLLVAARRNEAPHWGQRTFFEGETAATFRFVLHSGHVTRGMTVNFVLKCWYQTPTAISARHSRRPCAAQTGSPSASP
jgi:hypothetical protein